jgi:hypothetical protein
MSVLHGDTTKNKGKLTFDILFSLTNNQRIIKDIWVIELIFKCCIQFDISIIFSALYTRVWDEADYVIPPAENGAVFVATNVVITPNQTRGES